MQKVSGMQEVQKLDSHFFKLSSAILQKSNEACKFRFQS